MVAAKQHKRLETKYNNLKERADHKSREAKRLSSLLKYYRDAHEKMKLNNKEMLNIIESLKVENETLQKKTKLSLSSISHN